MSIVNRKGLCLLITIILSCAAFGQDSNVSIGTEALKDKALLWLKPNGNQGLLLPIISNRSTFTGLNNTDERGMLIFDASDNKVYYWNGSAWVEAGGVSGGGSNQTLTISGNTFNLTGAPASAVNLSAGTPQNGQALVWNGTQWTSASINGDVTGQHGTTLVSGLKGQALPSTLPSTTNALVYNGSAWAFQPLSSTGEANTATNVGSAGVGVFKQKTGVNLELQKINAGSNRISVTQDAINSEIDIDVVQANLAMTAAQVTGLGSLATLSSITSAQITDGTITAIDIQNLSVTPDKIAQAAATTGQVLKWDGAKWAPAADNTGTSTVPILANGEILTGNGTANSALPLGGDGTLNGGTLTIAPNAITTAKINNGAVTGDKIAQASAVAGQVLKWTGSTWAPGSDATGSPFTTANEVPRGDGTSLVASNIYSDGTNVGIGTSTPRGLFELQGGNIILSGSTGSPDDPVDIDFKTLSNVFKAKIWTDPLSNTLWFSTSTTPTTGKHLTIDPNGNIGINNTAPTARLDVAGTVKIADGTQAAGRVLTSDASGNASWQAQAASWRLAGNAGTTAANFVGTTDAVPLYFRTNNSNRVTISATGNVGIGNTTPNAALQFATAVSNRKIALYDNANNDHQFYGFGVQSGGLRYQTQSTLSSHIFYAGTSSTTSAELMRIDGNGRVGIGRQSTANALEVNGNASKTTSGTWAANSDRRIKTDIKDIKDAISTLKKLRPVTFKYTDYWRQRYPVIEDRDYYNFIAQEYRTVFPHAVTGSGEFIEGDPREVLQVDTYDAQVVAIKAVQELIDTVEQLKEENTKLKLEHEALKQQLIEQQESIQKQVAEIQATLNVQRTK